MKFKELKDCYIRHYKTLESIMYSSDIEDYFTTWKEELEEGENHFLQYFNLSNIQEWIDEIVEAIDAEFTKLDGAEIFSNDEHRLLLSELI